MLTPARSKDFEVLKDSDEMLPSNRKTFGVLGTEDALDVSAPAAAADAEVDEAVAFEAGFAFGVLVIAPVLDDLAAGAGAGDNVSIADGACAGEEAEVEAVVGSLGRMGCCGGWV
jgi:hypothetical protein